jgi:hypothetical protein
MAQAPKQPRADRASFVGDIVSDPKNVPDVMLLYGYLGASSEEDHERLYLRPDLTNYVEVPVTAILHQMAAAKEQDPHGGVTLWVKKDAALIYKMAPAAEALAHYFAGAIQAGALGAAAAPQPQPPQTIGACTIAQAVCPPITAVGPACTHLNTCGIDCSIVCPTHPPHATCAAGCTHVAPCPTHVATCAPQCTHTPCTVGGPACGVTLPIVCQNVTFNTCACTHTPCTVGGPACGVTLPIVCQNVTFNTCACTIVCTHAATCSPQCTNVPPCPQMTPACTHVFTCQPFCGGPTLACGQGGQP